MKENYEHESRERERERERVKAPSKNTFIKLQKIFALFLVTFFLFSATPALAFNPFTAIYDYFFPRTEIVQPAPIVSTPTPPSIPIPLQVSNPPVVYIGNQGSQGPQGVQGIQGPAGARGLTGASVDTSLFVLKSFLTAQVDRIYDSLGNSISSLSSALGESINTELLTVGGNATVEGVSTASYFNAISSVILKQNETLMFHTNKPVGSDGFNTSLGFQAGNSLSGATIGASTEGSYNTFLGYNSGLANTTGVYNTFTGANSGLSNTTGFINAFFGMNSGQANTTGNNNSFFGMNSGRNNTIGSDNTFVGMAAGRENTEGSYNTFVGLGAGYFNSTGAYNTYLGYESGRTGTTGIENTFVGMYSGREITTGANNTFLGSNAGRSTTAANFNVMIGSSAGFENLTGGDNVYIGQSAGRLGTAGSSNVFVGRESGMNNTAAGGTYVGIYSGTANTSGLHNTLLGGYAGADITEGGTNTFVGFDAGRGVTTGVGNTIVGANVEGLATGLTNNIILANGAGGIKAQHDGTNWTLASKVGIGTTPTQALTVGDGTSSLFANVNTTNSNIFIGESGSTRFGYAAGTAGLIFQGDAIALAMGTFGGGNFTLGTNNNAVITMTVPGKVGIGTTEPADLLHLTTGNLRIGASTATRATTAGTNQLILFDGTAPVGTLTNGISMYSTAGEAFIMDAAGNATLQSPHENENNYWVFDSRNVYTGKSLVVDMELMMKKLNETMGWDFVHETINGVPTGANGIVSLDLRIEGIEERIALLEATTNVGDSTSLFDRMKTWLADAGNGIVDLYAKVIHSDKVETKEVSTEKLCVKKSDGTNVCVTGDQLDALISGNDNGSNNNDDDTGGEDDPITCTAPKILINNVCEDPEIVDESPVCEDPQVLVNNACVDPEPENPPVVYEPTPTPSPEVMPPVVTEIPAPPSEPAPTPESAPPPPTEPAPAPTPTGIKKSQKKPPPASPQTPCGQNSESRRI